ncbi:MAG TPA: SMC-Scp complex subunit ScpB [Clostridiales bacterium]|nr:SMC-Scp complex subunit ScpB [Clostridiales bacterium]
MIKDKIPYAIEGILFAAGEPVKAAKLAAVLETDIDTVSEAVKLLKYNYDTEQRGMTIIDIDDGYQLCSRPDYYNYIQLILGEQRRQALSNAAMETLAIIAYKQPITKGQVEYIRGVNSDSAVNRLAERGLIEECGRLDAPGRPILYKTTQNFLRCFGISTPKDLPPLDMSQLGAEYEQISMDIEDNPPLDGQEELESPKE